MANWNGAARSNYVKIKDMEGLKKALEPFEIEISPNSDNPELHCLLSTCEDYGSWPSSAYDDETEEDIDFSFEEHVCPFMADDQILIVMEAGAEKLRYLTGWAEAYNAKGECVAVSLNDIYGKAVAKFGVPKEQITDCSY